MPLPIPARAVALHAAAFIAALALALPAHAVQKKKAPRRTKRPAAVTAPAKAAQPEPVQAAPVLPLAAERLPIVAAPHAVRGSPSIAFGAGLWSGTDVGKGFMLQVDYGVDRTPASWQRLKLEWRLAVLFARPTERNDFARVVTPLPLTTVASGFEETTAYVVEIVPTARARATLGRKVGFFLDAGAGIAQSIDTYVRDEMFVGRRVKKENVTGLVVRGGLGLSYEATPRLSVLLLPLYGSIEIGPKYSAFQPMLAVAFGL